MTQRHMGNFMTKDKYHGRNKRPVRLLNILVVLGVIKFRIWERVNVPA